MSTMKCATCGTHVIAETALMVSGQPVCSARCGEALPADAARAASVRGLPRRILVAFDGSGPAMRAVEYAVGLARAAGGTVRLLQAIEPLGLRGLGDVLPRGTLADVVREIEAKLRDDAEAHLEPARKLCDAAHVPYTVTCEFAVPIEAIRDAADDADLIVMGSRGLGAFSGAVLGSLTHRVPAVTSVPVLIVH